MVDFNPYIQIQPVQQVRRPQTLAGVQATGQVVAQPFELGKALGHLASSLAGVSKQKVAEEEQERKRAERDQQIATVQADAERLTEKQLGEIVHNRVKNGELPAGYDPFMMDLLERQAGRRAFRAFRAKADDALKSFNDPDFAGDPQEVFAQIQADVLAEYGAADQGAKFLGEFVTLRGELRDAWTTNAVNSRSNARQSQAIDGFADDVSVALQEFGNDAGALNNALANLMQEAAGSSVFVGYPKGKLSQLIATAVQAEIDRLIKLEDFEEARTLLDNFRTLNPRSRRLNGTPGDDESTDIRQPNSFAYDHGALISTAEASLQSAEIKASERDAGKSMATAGTTAGHVTNAIATAPEFIKWVEGLDPNLSEAEVLKMAQDWVRQNGFSLPSVAGFAGDINEKVEAIVLSTVPVSGVYGSVQQDRLGDLQGSASFSKILNFPPDTPHEVLEMALRGEMAAFGVSDSSVQSLMQIVLSRRNNSRNELLSPISVAQDKQKAAKVLAQFRAEDLNALTSDEYRRRVAIFTPQFEAISPEARADFIQSTSEEMSRREENAQRALRYRESDIRNFVGSIRRGGTLALIAKVEETGAENYEPPAAAILALQELEQEQADYYTKEIEKTLNSTQPDELERALVETRDRVQTQLIAQRDALVDELFRSTGARTKKKEAGAGLTEIRNLTELDDASDIRQVFAPLLETGSRPAAWSAVWSKDRSEEWNTAIFNANNMLRLAATGERGIKIINGEMAEVTPGLDPEVKWNDSLYPLKQWMGWDRYDALSLTQAKEAAIAVQVADAMSTYDYSDGRNIRVSGKKRLDKYGIAIPDSLLDPYKVPVFPKKAFQDPATSKFLAEYRAASNAMDAQALMDEWLAGESPGAEAYKLLPDKYQLDPPEVFGAQGAFFKAWNETQAQ